MTPAKTICLGFLGLIALGTFLLSLPLATRDGTWSSFTTALFTATSAVCVTGLSVVDVGQYYSHFGQVVLLLLLQIGGLGYMTTTTFLLLLIGRKFSLRDKLTLQQALDIPGIRGGINLVQSIIATTLIIEITGIFILLLGFAPAHGIDRGLWLAIFHSMSAFNNAGFSLFSDSLMGYKRSVLVNLTISGLIIAGGIGYQVLLEFFLWLRSKLWRSQERIIFSLNFRVAVSTTLVLLVVGTILFRMSEANSPAFQDLNFWEKWLAAWFQSVTTRTAGFNTVDISKLSVAGLFITIAWMFVGASPGGTGGGIKTTTARVLFACTGSALQGNEEVYIYERQVPHVLLVKAIGVAVGSLLTVICSTILLSITDPQFRFIEILFECASAFGTVGLSMGITPQISPPGQLVLVATMFVGRVGVMLLMAALMSAPKPKMIQYPEETLLVG
ncbi:MAG: TrkH family potassium uptake protein [Pseudanabaenaceae cyanobacterium SKYGB_i_bin29]|nr:TrkH family potassium uptake protein [Pseudanabaenaceae cyanobacterium SKYG29]MDW8421570.1 TrkH family potassium uptake protein [Pseudanabaenaceae cyanobacterium SKYGB_i_bin29]